MALPQTGFEQRGKVAPWTTFPEEATYIAGLLSEIPGLTRFQAGTGETGLPIWCYQIGTGSTHVLFVGQQHAPELAGREALLSRIRDWATDPEWEGYLQDVTVLVIPTARPDSQTVRNNANDVNLNRDHMQLTQGETVAIQQVISDYSPHVIVDVHEGANITNDYATSKVLNPNIHPDLFDMSADMEGAVKTAIEGGGWTWEPYQNWNIHGPEYFSNAGGLRHGVGLLLETKRRVGVDSDAEERHARHLVALDAILRWHQTNQAVVALAHAASQVRTLDAVNLVVGVSSSGPVLEPPPVGYVLTTAQESALAAPVTVFGLTIQDGPSGRTLLAAPHHGAIVHYLAHPSSSQALVAGIPIGEETRGVSMIPTPFPKFRIGASNRTVTATMVKLGTPTGPVTVWP